MQSYFNRNIANTVTLINIILGSLSLVNTMAGNYRMSAVLILFAVIMDGMDGRLARRLDSTSDLGKQLDSLCDLVSFGVAPALLIYDQVFLANGMVTGIFWFLLFISCGAYRLARFNVLNITTHFVGIPITLTGCLMAIISLLATEISPGVVAILVASLAILMVSTIKVRKFK